MNAGAWIQIVGVYDDATRVWTRGEALFGQSGRQGQRSPRRMLRLVRQNTGCETRDPIGGQKCTPTSDGRIPIPRVSEGLRLTSGTNQMDELQRIEQSPCRVGDRHGESGLQNGQLAMNQALRYATNARGCSSNGTSHPASQPHLERRLRPITCGSREPISHILSWQAREMRRNRDPKPHTRWSILKRQQRLQGPHSEVIP